MYLDLRLDHFAGFITIMKSVYIDLDIMAASEGDVLKWFLFTFSFLCTSKYIFTLILFYSLNTFVIW